MPIHRETERHETADQHCSARSLPLLLLAAASDSGAAGPISIKVRADAPGAVINPAIYGQFAEHLGRLIYEGIWVGEKSSIPNTRGYRNDVIAALKELGVPVLRWPGGCFADEYNWREGIGPRESASTQGQYPLGRRGRGQLFRHA